MAVEYQQNKPGDWLSLDYVTFKDSIGTTIKNIQAQRLCPICGAPVKIWFGMATFQKDEIHTPHKYLDMDTECNSCKARFGSAVKVTNEYYTHQDMSE